MDDSEKLNEASFSVKKRILQQLKHGKYYKCRLHASKKNL